MAEAEHSLVAGMTDIEFTKLWSGYELTPGREKGIDMARGYLTSSINQFVARLKPSDELVALGEETVERQRGEIFDFIRDNVPALTKTILTSGCQVQLGNGTEPVALAIPPYPERPKKTPVADNPALDYSVSNLESDPNNPIHPRDQIYYVTARQDMIQHLAFCPRFKGGYMRPYVLPSVVASEEFRRRITSNYNGDYRYGPNALGDLIKEKGIDESYGAHFSKQVEQQQLGELVVHGVRNYLAEVMKKKENFAAWTNLVLLDIIRASFVYAAAHFGIGLVETLASGGGGGGSLGAGFSDIMMLEE